MPVTLLVDAERLLVNYLLANFTIVALVADRVYTKLPRTPVYPNIVLHRWGGVPSKLVWQDDPKIQIDAWGRTDAEAWEVARQTFAVIMRIPQVHAQGIVLDARPEGPLLPRPDTTEEPPQPRVLFDIALTTRPLAA